MCSHACASELKSLQQYRGLTLQQDIDQAKAAAKYEDGVVELVLAKKETASAKQVTVK